MSSTGRRRNGALVEEEFPDQRDWIDNSGDLDVVFVDNLDDPEVFYSADEYFEQWVKNRDGLTVILPDEQAAHSGESSSFEIPFQARIDQFEQKLELFPRSQARRNPYIVNVNSDIVQSYNVNSNKEETRRNPYTVNPDIESQARQNSYIVNPGEEETKGRVYMLHSEDSGNHHDVGISHYDNRRDKNTVPFRRNDVKAEFLSPTIVNGIKYLELIEGKQRVQDTRYKDDFGHLIGDGANSKNDERRYERNRYDPRRIITDKKDERRKGVTFFKDDFFKNLERDWSQGQRWQPDLEKEMQTPRRKDKDRHWEDLLFLTDPKTEDRNHSGLFGEKLNLFAESKPPKKNFSPNIQSTEEERKTNQRPTTKPVTSTSRSRPTTPLPFLSGSHEFDEETDKHVSLDPIRRQDDGSDWVPIINSGSSWDPVPITTTTPVDSAFQMVVKYPRDSPTRPSYRKYMPHHRREGNTQVGWNGWIIV